MHLRTYEKPKIKVNKPPPCERCGHLYASILYKYPLLPNNIVASLCFICYKRLEATYKDKAAQRKALLDMKGLKDDESSRS